MTDLEKRFGLAMHNIHRCAKGECNGKHLTVEVHVLLPNTPNRSPRGKNALPEAGWSSEEIAMVEGKEL